MKTYISIKELVTKSFGFISAGRSQEEPEEEDCNETQDIVTPEYLEPGLAEANNISDFILKACPYGFPYEVSDDPELTYEVFHERIELILKEEGYDVPKDEPQRFPAKISDDDQESPVKRDLCRIVTTLPPISMYNFWALIAALNLYELFKQGDIEIFCNATSKYLSQVAWREHGWIDLHIYYRPGQHPKHPPQSHRKELTVYYLNVAIKSSLPYEELIELYLEECECTPAPYSEQAIKRCVEEVQRFCTINEIKEK